jgi:fumarate reductase (CoM/CoB) subunit A
MERLNRSVEADVLVVGGGAAGARAAIEAHRNNARVFLVMKGIFGAGGCTPSASIGSAVGQWSADGDSVELHFRDMVIQGKQFLCDQELARQQAEKSSEAVTELEQWGLMWDRDSKGRIDVFPSSRLFPGVSAHDRMITYGRKGTNAVGPFWTGHGMMDALREEVCRREIPYMQEVIISNILLRDGVLCGALGYDYLNSQTILFKCKAMVLATGDANQVYFPHTQVSRESTGDGFALAYEAGASLVDMEQFEYLALAHAFPDSARPKAVLETPCESGQIAYLVNSKGERFMEHYNKEMKELAAQEDFAKAIYAEVKAGRGGPHGGCFLDLRHIPRDVVKRAAPGRLESIERLGYDIRKDLIEVYPVIHTTTGGVRINDRCESEVPGLFVAGQLAFAVNDSVGEGGTGIIDAPLRGRIAGENAAAYSKSVSAMEPATDDLAQALDLMMAPLQAQNGPTPLGVTRILQRIMWEYVGIFKNESGLEKALEEILMICDSMLPNVATRIKTGPFNIDLLEAIELRHMIVAAEAITRSSIARKESRNRFHRSDYPERDDKNWLKHIVVRKSSEGMRIALEPVEFPYLKPQGL